MRQLLRLVVALTAWTSAVAHAQDFCTDVRAVLAAAPTEFAEFMGPPESGPWPAHLSVFASTQTLAGAGVCAIAQQTHQGRRFSTSLTCANVGRDDEDGMRVIRESLRQCLDVTEWSTQDNGSLGAQYGLLRLTITRNGAENGLALGVESFRDERGEVMGSPLRGDRAEPNGARRCSPRSPDQIRAFLTMYGERPGAERFEDRLFVGYTNRVSQPVVAFATRPPHPAHPALIVRSVREENGSVYLSASGDYAGDCEAFHALLLEVSEMNRNVR